MRTSRGSVYILFDGAAIHNGCNIATDSTVLVIATKDIPANTGTAINGDIYIATNISSVAAAKDIVRYGCIFNSNSGTSQHITGIAATKNMANFCTGRDRYKCTAADLTFFCIGINTEICKVDTGILKALIIDPSEGIRVRCTVVNSLSCRSRSTVYTLIGFIQLKRRHRCGSITATKNGTCSRRSNNGVILNCNMGITDN